MSKAWTTTIVPLSEHLYDQSTFLEPPEQWVSAHDELVEIWGERAQAYRSISEGLQVVDQAAWDAGKLKAEAASKNEEAWFNQVNEVLGPMGFMINAYP